MIAQHFQVKQLKPNCKFFTHIRVISAKKLLFMTVRFIDTFSLNGPTADIDVSRGMKISNAMEDGYLAI